ncbi:MAG TPA: O-antigen ligase family protein [Solirubrobacteraceae bacterium]|nr:O-antigen ligase family protein [Solirubrobacteraceae bacterium]
MPVELRLAAAFGIAAVGALALTPLARRLALRTAFLDQPVGYKSHAAPTPYLGGLAVVAAFALAAGVAGRLGELWPLVAGALALCALGTVDDRRTVRPSLRVLLEATLAAALWSLGLGWSVVSSDLVNLAVTVLWVVAVVNAFNLMDNMDGTAASCATASSLGIAGLAATTGEYEVAALALALAGACLGFLPFNARSPARIFLGDGGSMPVGFLVGALAMAVPALNDGAEWVGLGAVLLVGLPLTDTTLVTISRRRRGVSIMTGGRDHMTHRLLRQLGSAPLVALALGAAQASLAVLAIVGSELGGAPLVWIAVLCLALAGATILILDDGAVAVADGGQSSAESDAAPVARAVRPSLPVRPVLAAVLGFACGASPLVEGFYSFSVWGPIALGILALMFGLFVAGEPWPGRLGLAALAGLVALAVLAFLSTTWAESADRALVDADRWVLYAAFLGTALLLMHTDGAIRAALAGGAAGLLVVAGYILAVALWGDAPSLFQSGRLFEPLGYVNSQGLFLVVGIWPFVALAQYARNSVLAGVGAAGAAALAALAALSQARGVAFALIASVVAVLAFVPGRQRRAWLMVCVLGPVVALNGPLFDVYESAGASSAAYESAIRDAARAALLAAAIAGLAWGICFQLVSQVPPSSARRASAVALGLLIGGVVLVAAAKAPAITERAKAEVSAFRNLDPDGGRNRLLSGGGNRYDYWRIAVREFTDQPARGVGAGNYSRDYFLQRRTTEDIRQPHSIGLQTLAELGLLGAAGLALFVLAIAAGWRRRLAARPLGPGDRAMLVAAGGVFSAWFAHSSVDWSHLVPGAVGLGLVAVAYLVARPESVSEHRAAGRESVRASPGRLAARAAIGVAIGLAVLAIVRPVLAQHYRSQGEHALASDPVRALAKAHDSLSMNGQSMETRYLRAAAYARLGDYARARSELVRATELEPHNFVPWALLGDLAARRGDLALARRCYTLASQLNPQDQTLQKLSRKPQGENDHVTRR